LCLKLAKIITYFEKYVLYNGDFIDVISCTGPTPGPGRKLYCVFAKP